MKAGLGNPANYRDIFDLLERGGVLEPDLTHKFRGMAGYRNRLVHDYARLDEREMWGIIQNELGDLTLLLNRLLDYIAEKSTTRYE
nr:DUF86 domain-containing protein [Gelria sp. Kuro-4]